MHMHTYRRANTPEFQGKTVLVLGGRCVTSLKLLLHVTSHGIEIM